MAMATTDWTWYAITAAAADDSGHLRLSFRTTNDIELSHDSRGASSRPPFASPVIVRHVGQFGLGHRLSKLSAAHHLALSKHWDLEVTWGSCSDVEIFKYLFGTTRVLLPSMSAPRAATTTTTTNLKEIVIRNDVHGYYAGQMYKNTQLPLTDSLIQVWLHKMELDRQLYMRLLTKQFQFRNDMNQFQQAHDWNSHTVIGLHVRGGNGEMDHFAESQRRIVEPAQYVSQLVHLLALLPASNKPVMIFLATDTTSVIDMANEASTKIGIPIITYPQRRPAMGVSYTITEGDSCLEGWKDSWMDLALLACSDIVVAGMRSTFTQIVPLVVVLENHGGTYCEVGVDATRMTCTHTSRDWLLRTNSTTYALNGNDTRPVIHKLVVHLPEPNLQHPVLDQFVNGPENRMVYGERFSTKYRNKGSYREEWTWREVS